MGQELGQSCNAATAEGALPPDGGVVHWCRYDKKARERSPFALGHAWNTQGIGMLHGIGTVIALTMIAVAVLSRLTPMAARTALGVTTTILIGLAALVLMIWGFTLMNRDYPIGTPIGPDADHRVQCSASKKLRKRLGMVEPHAIEPDLFPVWLSDAPRAAGVVATAMAVVVGVGFMMVVNWVTFRDPTHSAFITLGLAGPSIGLGVLGVLLPVEWKISPGTLEIIRPGVLGLGWRASTETINLRAVRLFIDADDRRATILEGPRKLHLRWDLASRRDEITRMLLLAALTPEEPYPRIRND